jgi:hypothetical protein
MSGGDRRPDGGLALLGSILRVALVAAFVLSLAGALVPGRAGQVAEVIGLGLLIGAPVLRVAWLTVDWFREGDRRFAVLGLALLGVLGLSGVVGFL